MQQHDRGRHRRAAGEQHHDLALARRGEVGSGAADKTGIAIVLQERGAALGFPARGFQGQEYFDRGRDLLWRARYLETDFAVLGQPVALAA